MTEAEVPLLLGVPSDGSTSASPPPLTADQMAMAIEDIQAMGIDLENVDQLASLLEGLEDVNPGGGQEVVSGGVDSEAIEQALLQTLGTMTREQIEEAIASCQQLGVEAGTVPSDSDKNAHSNNGVYEGPHEPDAIKYKGSEFRVDMEGLGEVQHLPQGGHYDLSGIQLDEQTLSELQQLNESILGLGNDGQGGIGKLLQQSDIDNSGGQALMMDNQEDSLRQRRMSDTGNNIGSFGGGARTHDAASPHLSVFSDHTAPATQSVGKAPDSEVQSLINLDLTSLPEDETQISSWIAEQLHTLQDTGDEVGERLDRFMNGKRSSSVEHRNTGRGRTLSESRTSSGRVTSLDRDRVREENRERKKRWREINQDRSELK